MSEKLTADLVHNGAEYLCLGCAQVLQDRCNAQHEALAKMADALEAAKAELLHVRQQLKSEFDESKDEPEAPTTLDPALREPLRARIWDGGWVPVNYANARIAELVAWIDGEPQRTKEAIDRRINSMFGPVGSGSNEAESRDRLRLRGFAQAERRLAELENQVAGESERTAAAVAAKLRESADMIRMGTGLTNFSSPDNRGIIAGMKGAADYLEIQVDELAPPPRQGGTEEVPRG